MAAACRHVCICCIVVQEGVFALGMVTCDAWHALTRSTSYKGIRTRSGKILLTSSSAAPLSGAGVLPGCGSALRAAAAAAPQVLKQFIDTEAPCVEIFFLMKCFRLQQEPIAAHTPGPCFKQGSTRVYYPCQGEYDTT